MGTTSVKMDVQVDSDGNDFMRYYSMYAFFLKLFQCTPNLKKHLKSILFFKKKCKFCIS